MSKIDTTFAALRGAILSAWGQNITLVKTTTPRTYDPATGNVTGADTPITVKGVIMKINSSEAEGLYQATDLKVLIGNEELGTYYPTEADRIQYMQADITREAKILNVTSYRGDDPIMHTLIVRPQ